LAIEAFGAGKVILLGEHAVVYGAPALACALGRGVLATATPAPKTVLEIPPALRGAPRARVKKAFEIAASQAFFPKVRVRLSSDLPLAVGLGSSAALSVAVASVLAKSSGRAPSVESLARSMETVFHQTPSGVDHSTSLLGGLIRFQKSSRGPKIQRLQPPVPLSLLVAVVGPRGSTALTVQGLREKVTRWPRRCHRIFREMGALVDEAVAAVKKGDLPSLGDAMNVNHGLLAALQLSSPPLDDMVYRLRQLGALGAKLTGAGGKGGAVVGLFENPGPALSKLRKQGVTCFVTSLQDAPK